MKTLVEIRSATKTYAVHAIPNLHFVQERAKDETCFFVIDKTVYALYAKDFADIPASRLFILEALEENKTIEVALEICERLIGMNSKRNTHLISMGGGIVQDVTGFVANILYRGIHWTFVPTTLLAACDSCIGGKSSLNYKSYKNLLGTFFPPDEILLYAAFFQSLSKKDLLSGLGEVVKFNIIAGADTVELIEHQLDQLIACNMETMETFLASSLQFKKKFIEADEFDRGERIKLNFAHTFGHAIEVSSHYEIPHGTAVAMGTVVANAISVHRGMMSLALEKRLDALLASIIYVDTQHDFLQPDVLLAAIRKDKKQTSAEITAVLMDGTYELHCVHDVQVDEIHKGFSHLESFLKNK